MQGGEVQGGEVQGGELQGGGQMQLVGAMGSWHAAPIAALGMHAWLCWRWSDVTCVSCSSTCDQRTEQRLSGLENGSHAQGGGGGGGVV